NESRQLAGRLPPDGAGTAVSLWPASGFEPRLNEFAFCDLMTKVLIIEDEKPFARLLQRSLEREDIGVEWAATLDEGLAGAQSGEFDVVVSDLYLGARNALELIDRLRPINPYLPVIIMTAKHTTETAIEAT